MLTPEQQRVIMKLLPFGFTSDRSGCTNSGVDALSQWPQHADFLALAIPHGEHFDDLETWFD